MPALPAGPRRGVGQPPSWPRALAVAAALAVLVTGCSSAPDAASDPSTETTTPTTVPEPTTSVALPDPTPAPLDWHRCEDGLECATLTVPVDYDDPALGTLDLAVMRRRASEPSNRIGSLVANPGGPGGSGLNMVRNGYGVASGLNRRFDIVSWDPRGVGNSTALNCGSGADRFLALDRMSTTPEAEAALDAGAASVAQDCADHGGPLLGNVDSVTTARDLEQLRRALGEGPLNYAGYSYGTAIGLSYLERYPDQVRALVLDGVVEPEWDLEGELGAQTTGFDDALDVTFQQCDARRSCPVTDARATYDRLSARLAAAPASTGGGNTFGPTELAIAAVSSAYSPDRTERFLQGLAAADGGDTGPLRQLVDAYESSVKSYATYAAVVCADLPHPVGAEAYRAFASRLAAQSPRFGAVIANEMLPCAFWPSPTTGRPHPVTVSGPPVLVVGTTGDPATPYVSAQSVAADLPGAVLLTDEGTGHTSGGRSGCVNSAVRQYLFDLVLPAAGTRCADGT